MTIKNNIYNQKQEFFTIFLILIFVVCKLPHLGSPYYWDESWVYAPAVRTMYENGLSLLPSALSVDYSRGHPLLFHFLAAGWLKIFGTSFIAAHSFALFVSCCCLGAIFCLGRGLFSPNVGLAATLLVAAQSMFFVQSSFLLPEVMVALWILLALLFFHQQRWVAYFLAASALLLTKESGITLIASLLIFVTIKEYITNNTFFYKKLLFQYLFILLPCLPMGVFFVIQKNTFGWFLYPEHIGMMQLKWSNFLHQCRNVLEITFVINGRFILLAFFVGSLFYAFYKRFFSQTKKALFKLEYLFLFLFLVTYIVFCALNFVTARYLISCIVVATILFAALISDYLSLSAKPFFLGVFALCFIFVGYALKDKSLGDCSLGAFDAMRVKASAVHFLEAENAFDKPVIVREFLSQVALKNIYSGYLQSSKFFTDLRYELTPGAFLLADNTEPNAIVAQWAQENKIILVKKFESGPAWAAIYQVK